MTTRLKEYFCYSCDGTFKVKHEMDQSKYPISHCTFCGSELDSDDEYGVSDVDDSDDHLDL